MAVRKPVIWDTGTSTVKEMTPSQINEVIAQVSYQYSLDPSVSLSVVSSGGSLGGIDDTRLQAGTYVTRAGDGTPTAGGAAEYYDEANTPEPTTVTVTHDKINQTVATLSAPTASSGKTLPLYWTGSGLRVMTDDDFYNTFIEPAIDNLVSGSTGTAQGGTYQIFTSTSLSGNTLVSSTPVFTDTRADTSLYTADGIPETLDQPTAITSYYLFRINGAASSYSSPLYLRTGDNNLQTYASADFNTLIQDYVKYAAANRTNYKIRYSLSSGTNRGSGIVDTKLDGAGNYQTFFGGADDYRSQEFPNGTPQTISTNYLKISKTA